MNTRNTNATVRPRTVISTDPELDDLNSMLRLLLHANEIDIEALVVTSSKFHWAGESESGLEGHRWPPANSRLHIHEAIDAYEQVHANLVVHDSAYPSPATLRGRTAIGNVRSVGDVSQPTAGSRLIEEAILREDPRVLYVQHWGGMNTTARALMSIEERFAGTTDWEARRAAITARLVLSSFSEQDDLYADYIRPRWPGLEFRDVATDAWGYFARSVADAEDLGFLAPQWMRDNVSEVGPMGEAYRVWGDGKQMAPGDVEDYFGECEMSAEALRERGFFVWAPPEPAGSWISEGDSSNFAPLIANGLRAHENPTFGGWGGRLVADADDPNRFGRSGVPERTSDGSERAGWSVARWLPDYQRELAGRLRWTVTGDFAAANHPPLVLPVGETDREVRAGDALTLSLEATDPDGDPITIEWWQYREAGAFGGDVDIAADGSSARVTVPARAVAGESIHVVATVRDAGVPSFARYLRFVLTVVGS